MDSIARYNKERWEELSRANVDFSKPMLDLTKESAWRLINREQIELGEVRGKDVLCLAASGGQQSAGFGLLGANVTVFDICESQLRKDVETAEHYGFPIRVEHGDMRDLGVFQDDSFDIVWLSFAINYVPDPSPVIKEAVRVLRSEGYFYMSFANPLAPPRGNLEGADWEGYLLTEPYVQGAEIVPDDPDWIAWSEDKMVKIQGPRMFRHTLSTILNLLIQSSLGLLGFWDDQNYVILRNPPEDIDPNPEPGTWAHYITVCPPEFSLWARKSGQP